MPSSDICVGSCCLEHKGGEEKRGGEGQTGAAVALLPLGPSAVRIFDFEHNIILYIELYCEIYKLGIKNIRLDLCLFLCY